MGNQRYDEFRPRICCICGKEYMGYGNNPEPVKGFGKCCNDCNEKKVIPARMLMMSIISRRKDV